MHPLDFGAGNVGDTYDANTLLWGGAPKLKERESVKISSANQIENPYYESLKDVFARHMQVISRTIYKITKNHNPHDPMPEEMIETLRKELGEIVRRENYVLG